MLSGMKKYRGISQYWRKCTCLCYLIILNSSCLYLKVKLVIIFIHQTVNVPIIKRSIQTEMELDIKSKITKGGNENEKVYEENQRTIAGVYGIDGDVWM